MPERSCKPVTARTTEKAHRAVWVTGIVFTTRALCAGEKTPRWTGRATYVDMFHGPIMYVTSCKYSPMLFSGWMAEPARLLVRRKLMEVVDLGAVDLQTLDIDIFYTQTQTLHVLYI